MLLASSVLRLKVVWFPCLWLRACACVRERESQGEVLVIRAMQEMGCWGRVCAVALHLHTSEPPTDSAPRQSGTGDCAQWHCMGRAEAEIQTRGAHAHTGIHIHTDTTPHHTRSINSQLQLVPLDLPFLLRLRLGWRPADADVRVLLPAQVVQRRLLQRRARHGGWLVDERGDDRPRLLLLLLLLLLGLPGCALCVACGMGVWGVAARWSGKKQGR